MTSFKMRLTSKFMLGVLAILAVTMIANLVMTNKRVNGQANDAFTDKLRQITGMALTVRDWASEHQEIFRTAEQSKDGKRDISAVPVVQAWQITEEYANAMNIEFRTPSLSPRNPDNQAVGFEREALLAFQSDPSMKEYVERREDSDGQEYVHYAVPVYLGKGCLECHGFPKGELDPYGFAKEGMSEGDLRAAFVLKANAAALIANEAGNTQYMLWSTLTIMLLVCGGIFWSIRKMVTAPLAEVGAKMEAIAVGDIRQQIDYKSNDEIGDVAKSFGKMTEYLSEMAEAADQMAAGNLKVDVKPKSREDALGNSFKKMSRSLRDMIVNVSKTSESLLSASTEISSNAEQMASGAKQQTDQTTQVSTAVEEMTATVVETSKNASEASTVATQASEMATVGSEVVTETIAGMQRIADVVSNSATTIGELAKSADQIGEIISVIDEIADQTNLLALNAAIEAARAGEQGRGFAVVADEVRKLAERTTKATAEITGMIKGIQRDTGDAVKSMEEGTSEVNTGRELADRAGDSLNEILNMSQRVNSMIQQIATAAEEQSAAAEEISRNVEQIANVTQETAKGASESAFASEDLNKQAEGLSRIVSEFKV
jgi:methyl-accepting chemotaxis protein